MTRPYITPEMLARINADARAVVHKIDRIIPGEWLQVEPGYIDWRIEGIEPRGPYNGDLAYRLFTYGIGMVALVVIVIAVFA